MKNKNLINKINYFTRSKKMQNQNIENYDYEKDFLNKVEEEKKKYKRPNILICGYTGAGKTSIIQALLGKDLVPDNKDMKLIL